MHLCLTLNKKRGLNGSSTVANSNFKNALLLWYCIYVTVNNVMFHSLVAWHLINWTITLDLKTAKHIFVIFELIDGVCEWEESITDNLDVEETADMADNTVTSEMVNDDADLDTETDTTLINWSHHFHTVSQPSKNCGQKKL